MTGFKVGEALYFVAPPGSVYSEYDGKILHVTEPLGMYSGTTSTGEKAQILGYGIQFEGDSRKRVVKEGYLSRGTLERGDMDKLVTWNFVELTTGWKRRDEAA